MKTPKSVDEKTVGVSTDTAETAASADTTPAHLPLDIEALVERQELDLLIQNQLLTKSGARKTTTWQEIIAYYVWYAGAGGLAPVSYGQVQVQNLLSIAGYDPTDPTGQTPCGTGACYVSFAGKPTSISSVVLKLSGISFAIQSLFFLFAGSFADYGTFRPWLTIFWTVVSYGAGFAWLGTETPGYWTGSAVVLIVSQIAYNISNVYFIAASVGLARDSPAVQESEAAVLEGRKTAKEHAEVDIRERNRISNVSYGWLNLGSSLFCVVAVGILVGLHADDDYITNTKAYSSICAIATAFWVVMALPWQILEKHRPGLALPPNTNYLTIGLKNAWMAAKELRYLTQAAIYLVAFFIITDTITTMTTTISIAQSIHIAYSLKSLNYFLILEYGCSGLGILTYWYIQRAFNLSTKTIVLMSAGGPILIGIWGLVGIWTTKFGFQNIWEFWVYAVIEGWLVIPWYQTGFTMIADVVPVGKVFLFFSLFGIMGKTSAFVGPFITAAIVDRMGGNTNGAFAFLFPSAVVGFALLCFVNPLKAKVECRKYLEDEARQLYLKTEAEIRAVEEPLEKLV